MAETTYKLDELAKAAGTSPRTVRYYVQRGLLPPPTFRGKDTAYSREHLVRLRAIRKLQDAYLPLDAIAVELEGKTAEAIERIAEGKDLPQVPSVRLSSVSRPEQATTSAARPWRRLEIARGLELHVADDASADAKALAERIMKAISNDDGREGA